MTAQTLQNPVRSLPIILNGNILRLGAFDDVIFNGCEEKQISIGFELTPVSDELEPTPRSSIQRHFLVQDRMSGIFGSIKCTYSFSAKGSEDKKEVLQLQPRLEKCAILVSPKSDAHAGDDQFEAHRTNKDLKERLKDYQLNESELEKEEIDTLEYEILQPAKTSFVRRHYFPLDRFSFHVARKLTGCTFDHFLPKRISIVFDETEARIMPLVDFLTKADSDTMYFRYGFGANPAQEIDINFEFKTLVRQALNDVIIEIEPKTRKLPKVQDAMSNLGVEFSYNNLLKSIETLNREERQLLEKKFAGRGSELYKLARGERPSKYSMGFVSPPRNVSQSHF